MIRKALKILFYLLKLLVFLLGISIVLMYYLKHNIIRCDEIVDSKLLITLKEELYEVLIMLTQDSSFKETYCSQSRVFNILYIYNPSYIKDFVENLPLEEIINENSSKGVHAITQVILDLFIKDITLQFTGFGNKIKLISNLLFTGKICIPYLFDMETLIDAKNNLKELATPHIDATETEHIITDDNLRRFQEYSVIERNIVNKWSIIRKMSMYIYIEGDSKQMLLQFYYKFNFDNISFIFLTTPIELISPSPSPADLFFLCHTLWFIILYMNAP